MADDLLTVLTRFHREVVLPDIERIVDIKVDALRDDMNAHFDEIYTRLDFLRGEYDAVVAGIKRLEQRMDRLDQRMDGVERTLKGMDLRQELAEIKARLVDVEQRLAELEAEQ